ncbi:hypothetical protein BCR34DRAFT_583489 [Clohesyomyces aquaticus]|uniref:Uncharacterized protein n=1 Tax=Clohesyomyces aquaticus TaxID=1231657 RepID=A0A1Y2A537_9PLEO|nr:hypothetical protein BCR34DRAFT_583489 [Clohesyomyces aquaticus]
MPDSDCKGASFLDASNESIRCVRIDTVCGWTDCNDVNGQHCYGINPTEHSAGYYDASRSFSCDPNSQYPYCVKAFDVFANSNAGSIGCASFPGQIACCPGSPPICMVVDNISKCTTGPATSATPTPTPTPKPQTSSATPNVVPNSGSPIDGNPRPQTSVSTRSSALSNPTFDAPSTQSVSTPVPGPSKSSIYNPTDAAEILKLLQSAIPQSAQTNPQAACFLRTSSNSVYTTPPWYTTLPPAAKTYFSDINTNFAACTATPSSNSSSSSGGSLSTGEKAGIGIGSVIGAVTITALIFLLFSKLGIIGGGSAAAATAATASTSANAGTSATPANTGTSAAPANTSTSAPNMSANPYSGTSGPTPTGWNGVVNPGWNGIVAPPPTTAVPPPPFHSGGSDFLAIGALGRTRNDSGRNTEYHNDHRFSQGQTGYPIQTTSPTYQQQQGYGYSPPLNTSQHYGQGQYYGGGDGRVSPIEAEGRRAAYEAGGDTFHPEELGGNPRYEFGDGRYEPRDVNTHYGNSPRYS